MREMIIILKTNSQPVASHGRWGRQVYFLSHVPSWVCVPQSLQIPLCFLCRDTILMKNCRQGLKGWSNEYMIILQRASLPQKRLCCLISHSQRALWKSIILGFCLRQMKVAAFSLLVVQSNRVPVWSRAI